MDGPELLLVLGNCEQVLTAVAVLVKALLGLPRAVRAGDQPQGARPDREVHPAQPDRSARIARSSATAAQPPQTTSSGCQMIGPPANAW